MKIIDQLPTTGQCEYRHMIERRERQRIAARAVRWLTICMVITIALQLLLLALMAVTK